MATTRASDRARGERYTWLTPGPAQHLLLGFDQGWSQATELIELRDAVKITRMKSQSAPIRETRRVRKAALEAKETSGEVMTRREAQALARMRDTDELRPEPLPTSEGPITEIRGLRTGNATVVGGKGLPKVNPKKHPNLLAGRDRHFGAKLAQPGLAFQEAVDKAVAEHLAQTGETTGGATQTGVSPADEA
jgi:hypothetical protein